MVQAADFQVETDMFEIIFILILAAFVAGGIWAFVVSKKVKKEGFETEAVVSRVHLHEWSGGTGDLWPNDSITVEYYITYTNSDGKTDHTKRTRGSKS